MASVNVTLENGEILKVQEVCKMLSWESQSLNQSTDLLILPLRGCDLVLKVQLLQTLGPIVWDFSTLSMQFTQNDQMFTLKGIQCGTIHFASKKQMAKLPCTKSTNTLLL